MQTNLACLGQNENLTSTHEPNDSQAEDEIEQNVQTSIEVKAALEELEGLQAKGREGAVAAAESDHEKEINEFALLNPSLGKKNGRGQNQTSDGVGD